MGALEEARPSVSWSTPDARLVLPVDSPEEQWHAERRNGIGGSEAAPILGLSDYSSPNWVWREKLGLAPPRIATPQMRWGTKCEQPLAELFTEDTGIAVRRAGLMENKARPWMRGNVDRLTSDGGLLEVKTTGFWSREDWDNEQIADAAELQVLWYMAVTGIGHAWVIAKVSDDPWVIRRVERDNTVIEDMITGCGRFWHDNVLKRVEPPLMPIDLESVKEQTRDVTEGKVAFGDADEVEHWTQEHVAGAEKEKAGKAQKALADANLRRICGDAETLRVLDQPVLTCKANGTFSAARFTEEHPDLAAELETTKPALDMDRLKTEHADLYSKYRARVLRLVTTKGK